MDQQAQDCHHHQSSDDTQAAEGNEEGAEDQHRHPPDNHHRNHHDDDQQRQRQGGSTTKRKHDGEEEIRYLTEKLSPSFLLSLPAPPPPADEDHGGGNGRSTNAKSTTSEERILRQHQEKQHEQRRNASRQKGGERHHIISGEHHAEDNYRGKSNGQPRSNGSPGMIGSHDMFPTIGGEEEECHGGNHDDAESAIPNIPERATRPPSSRTTMAATTSKQKGTTPLLPTPLQQRHISGDHDDCLHNTGGNQNETDANHGDDHDHDRLLTRLMANAMNSMTKGEREQAAADVHGVNPHSSERNEEDDPGIVELCQNLINAEISKKRAKAAYNRAMFLSPKYASDPNLRLMFLRSTNFEVLRATDKYISYFEQKLRLFGLDSLIRPLSTCDSLSVDDRRVLESGSIQIAPFLKDNQGRTLMFDVVSTLCTANHPPSPTTSTIGNGISAPGKQHGISGNADLIIDNGQAHHDTGSSSPPPDRHQKEKEQAAMRIKSRVKVWWFLLMKALENDQEMQRRGVVAIVHCIHVRPPNHEDHARRQQELNLSVIQEYLQEIQTVSSCLPIRYISQHFCFNQPGLGLENVLARLCQNMSKSKRVRVQMFIGQPAEVQTYLGSFGISHEQLPIDSDGNVRTSDEFRRYISRLDAGKGSDAGRREMKLLDFSGGRSSNSRMDEEIDHHEDATELPRSADVLCGRGAPFQRHPGNIRLQELVEQFRAQHEASSYGEKTEICTNIISIIDRSGGRFLKRTNDKGSNSVWEIVDPSLARDKVAHSFRTKTNTKKRKNKKDAGGERGDSSDARQKQESQQQQQGKKEGTGTGGAGDTLLLDPSLLL